MPWFGSGNDRLGWTDAALERAWPEFELCFECMGAQLCPTCQGVGHQGEADARTRCSYCYGVRWCPVCGGAGQWPLNPSIWYFAPRAPCIDLENQARDRAVQGRS